MWHTLSEPWRIAFAEAWEAYCQGSLPIGAVIIDQNGQIVSSGRNRIMETSAPDGQVCNTKLAHAELNALLQLKSDKHSEYMNYSIYTTMEPCPLCFGAIVMSRVGTIYYGAKDRVGGAVNLNDTENAIVKGRELKIYGPQREMEILQLAIKTDFLKRTRPSSDRLQKEWSKDCPNGIALGKLLFEEGVLQLAKARGDEVSEVIDLIWERGKAAGFIE